MSAQAAPSGDSLPAAVDRDWLLLAAATVAFGFGFGIYTGTAPSFAVSFLHLERTQLGLLESLREVPGLLTAAIVGLAASIAAPRLALAALLVVGAGFAVTGQVRTFWPLVVCNVLWSVGLHVWLTVQPSLTLSLSGAGRHGYALGLMSRYLALAVIAGLLFVRIAAVSLGYGGTFLVSGFGAALGGVFLARIPQSRGGRIRQRLVFRPAYWRYYGLMLLDGGRRQVVQTFALLILVLEFKVSLESVAMLLLVNNALTMIAAPVVGRWTDRLGERRVLTAYYLLVAGVFLLYTRITMLAEATQWPPQGIFFVIFAVDNLLFTASVGIQTYIRHIAPSEDLSASLAMGLTWNHVAAVTVPVAAGVIWATYGYERIFACGIVLALASVAMCMTLPKQVRRSH